MLLYILPASVVVEAGGASEDTLAIVETALESADVLIAARIHESALALILVPDKVA